MADVKNLFLLTQIHERQGIRLSVEEGEAVVKFSDRANDLMKKLGGKLEFDSEPSGYLRTLKNLREGK